jgi:hypothetical protein
MSMEFDPVKARYAALLTANEVRMIILSHDYVTISQAHMNKLCHVYL